MSDDQQPGTSVAHYDANQPATSGGVIGNILAMAKDPTVDAAKVETLTNLAIRLQDRELRAEFNRDKIAAIREMPAIYKRGKSDKHRYAKFEDLHRACMPVLARHALTLDFRVGNDGPAIIVQPILRHDNGHVEEGGVMKGLPDKGPGRSDIQAVGSATSYLKRHSMKAMLNIIEDDEDNDGVGFRPDEQKNDRQERLILDAEAAAMTGDYQAFYDGLTAKDRSYLIRTGTHTRITGAPALPPISTSPVGRDERPIEPEPEDAVVEPVVDEARGAIDERPEPTPDVTTPEGWTVSYERRCKDAEDDAALNTIERASANALKKLSDEHPKLWERADRAMLDARDRVRAGTPAGDDMFPGNR